MSGLSDNDRQFLAYALDRAEDRMMSHPREFDADDMAALSKLRHVADCPRLCAELCGRENRAVHGR